MNVEVLPKTETEYKQMVEARGRVSIPATFISYKRSQRKVYPRYALLRIENVTTKEQADKYLGRGVEMYIPKTKVQPSGYKERVVMGYISRTHGNSGVLRARFEKNLSASYLGTQVYVKLYMANTNYFQKD
ncbi:large subunit ribosomal protein L35Ae [Nematocida sp. LUAm3]|nr:large subunit ribosomal protein L35Ae [Nematocida sp. LUAm3]KAI5175192.1 large subunit ribosomal protein L35Ae [Nematocida sp. LUAm2]KAI5178136.1 large subunit ribosomal protein L35Ae [Nematocida sp. LUAm1]